jgi:hypothetical protein
VIRKRTPQGCSVMCRQLSAEREVLDQYELAADYLFMAAGSKNTTRLPLKSQATGELKGAVRI